MTFLKFKYTYPGGGMKYSRMFHGFLAKYHILELLGMDTKLNQGLNFGFRDSQVPAMTAFILNINAYFFLVTIAKIIHDT